MTTKEPPEHLNTAALGAAESLNIIDGVKLNFINKTKNSISQDIVIAPQIFDHGTHNLISPRTYIWKIIRDLASGDNQSIVYPLSTSLEFSAPGHSRCFFDAMPGHGLHLINQDRKITTKVVKEADSDYSDGGDFYTFTSRSETFKVIDVTLRKDGQFLSKCQIQPNDPVSPRALGSLIFWIGNGSEGEGQAINYFNCPVIYRLHLEPRIVRADIILRGGDDVPLSLTAEYVVTR